MATVKGDVHDIGKNIVGVVLGCNSYEVVDLGVMVPADKILDTAIEQECDIIGLSGLITPSLDEMVYVAKEMQRRGMTQPLLVGGATTSKQHTAVKIAPEFEGSTVHVLDASRVVNVVSELLDSKRRGAFDEKNRSEQDKMRRLYDYKQNKPMLPLAMAQENGVETNWGSIELPKPAFSGRRIVDDVSLSEIREYIDWTLFFSAWELKGKFPRILEHEKVGEAARELYGNATKLLDEIIEKDLLKPRGVYGFWPANRIGDDIVLWKTEARKEVLHRFPMLRQQAVKANDQPYYSLVDYIAPEGHDDWIGAFAVTAGLGAQELVAKYEADHDDYNAIMVKSLADRCAEAFAELMHARARKDWGYGADENLSQEDIIRERYRGIRPAFGYPACPDHTEKATLWKLLEAEEAGIELTENFAMTPAASVSGLYFSHPESRYFGVGKIGEDQLEDYAKRKGVSLEEMRRWLAPNL